MDYNLQPRLQISALQTTEQKQWGMFAHLSQLLSFVIPFGGIAAPIIIWQVKKDEFPALDAHGKMIMNWTISSIIYIFSIFFLTLLSFFSIGFAGVIIGFLIFFAFGIISIVFPIIGGIKANKGELWEYPLTIEFLK